MISEELRNQMNACYYQLELKQAELLHGLFHRIFELESGWYNGHYHRKGADGWERDAFPIPVIGVKGLCDVEIYFDKVLVSTKRKRKDALEYSYSKIMKYPFEAYGVEDYLSDFYHKGQSLQELKDNIINSEEKEIAFEFAFPFEVEGEQMYEFAKLLRREGFYY